MHTHMHVHMHTQHTHTHTHIHTHAYACTHMHTHNTFICIYTYVHTFAYTRKGMKPEGMGHWNPSWRLEFCYQSNSQLFTYKSQRGSKWPRYPLLSPQTLCTGMFHWNWSPTNLWLTKHCEKALCYSHYSKPQPPWECLNDWCQMLMMPEYWEGEKGRKALWVNRGKSDGLGVRKHEFSNSKAISAIVSQRRKDSPSQR